MPDESERPTEYLTGVPLPVGRPKRLLIVDRTGIEAAASPQFKIADLHIGARTPIVYTMTYRNLVRLLQVVMAAVAELEIQDDHDGRK